MFLQFAIECRHLRFPSDYTLPKARNMYDTNDELYSVMFGRPRTEIRKALNGFLVQSGFIVPSNYPEGFWQIAPVFEGSFDDRNLTIDTIEQVLFPHSTVSDLTLDDYSHVKSEIDRSARIIQKSLDEGATGANILLWGPAGTGKTELALTMAKEHGWRLRSIGDISDTDAVEKSRAHRISNLKIAIKLFKNDKNTVLLFDEIEDLFKVDNNATFSKAFINRIIETSPVPIIWTTNSLLVVGSPVLRRMTYNINCSTPPEGNAAEDVA